MLCQKHFLTLFLVIIPHYTIKLPLPFLILFLPIISHLTVTLPPTFLLPFLTLLLPHLLFFINLLIHLSHSFHVPPTTTTKILLSHSLIFFFLLVDFFFFFFFVHTISVMDFCFFILAMLRIKYILVLLTPLLLSLIIFYLFYLLLIFKCFESGNLSLYHNTFSLALYSNVPTACLDNLLLQSLSLMALISL